MSFINTTRLQRISGIIILAICAALLLCSKTSCFLFAKQSTAIHQPLRIAVAANFSPVLHQLLPQFSQATNIQVEVISAATGVLYQQLRHGAPFDLFLGADNIHTVQLINDNIAIDSSLTTYAIGQLSLWSANIDSYSLDILNNLEGKLAIANPELAPYGKAAKSVLVSLNLWDKIQPQLITGINVNQTFQQIRSGATTLGFVANSQLVLNGLSGINIPEHLHAVIEQQLVIIKNTKQHDNAQQFIDFLMSEQTQLQLTEYGYLNAMYNSKAEN